MAGPVAAAKLSRVRQRKLNPKQNIGVLSEDDLETFEANEATLKEISTGVEAHEEQEHHLQAIINAAQAAAAGGGTAPQAYIPTRGTSESNLQYDSLYSSSFSQPATYIRFSSTVEDCTDGALYDLIDDDEIFLKSLNEKLQAHAQQASSRPTSRSASAAAEATPKNCTEGQFETLMAAFEAAAKTAAPFSNSVSGDLAAPILSLEEQMQQFSDTLPEESSASSPSRSHALLRALAPLVYPHWQSRRQANQNSPLVPALKVKVLETGDALHDDDPYVCFRRREVRAVRKTRGRDALSAEKLRRLRRELEDARNLVAMVRQRETFRKEQLATDRLLFEQRASLRGVKRTLTDKLQEGDEELLVNQKPRKPKPLETVAGNRTAPNLRLPASRAEAAAAAVQRDGLVASSGPELQLLSDWIAAREQRQVEEIRHKIQQHNNWNSDFVDMTRAPLTPPPVDDGIFGGFRAARTEYLPTPPASIASEESRGANIDELGKPGAEEPSRDRLSITGRSEAGLNAGPSPPEDPMVGVTPDLSTNVTTTPGNLDESLANNNVALNSKARESHTKSLPLRVRYASPDDGEAAPTSRSPSFRRRIGRGGRLFIDRRNMRRVALPEPEACDPGTPDSTLFARDRFRFDRDSDDDVDDDPNFTRKELMDPMDWRSMLLRAQFSNGWYGSSSQHAAHQAHQKQRMAQLHASQAQAQAQSQAQSQASAASLGTGNSSSPQTAKQQAAAQ